MHDSLCLSHLASGRGSSAFRLPPWGSRSEAQPWSRQPPRANRRDALRPGTRTPSCCPLHTRPLGPFPTPPQPPVKFTPSRTPGSTDGVAQRARRRFPARKVPHGAARREPVPTRERGEDVPARHKPVRRRACPHSKFKAPLQGSARRGDGAALCNSASPPAF